MKKFIVLGLLFYCSLSFSQNSKPAIDYYNEGVQFFNQKNYKIADSLFKISDSLEHHPDTYYNMAITKKAMGDKCGYCNNLSEAAFYYDSESEKLFNKDCIKKFELKYGSDTAQYLNKVTFNLCKRDTSQSLYKIFKQDTILVLNTQENLHGFLMGKYILRKRDSIQVYLNIDTIPLNINLEREIYSNYQKHSINKKNFEITEATHFPFKENIIMPEFDGGEKGRVTFLQQNMMYPQNAKENGIQGTVYVSFIVDENGKISYIKVLRGIGGGCDEEAVRVVKNMPRWKPAIDNGKKVRVKFNMPIRFTLN